MGHDAGVPKEYISINAPLLYQLRVVLLSIGVDEQSFYISMKSKRPSLLIAEVEITRVPIVPCITSSAQGPP